MVPWLITVPPTLLVGDWPICTPIHFDLMPPPAALATMPPSANCTPADSNVLVLLNTSTSEIEPMFSTYPGA
jgi:hypothetical protein